MKEASKDKKSDEESKVKFRKNKKRISTEEIDL